MNWLIIPVEELKQFDKDWEHRRKSIDGSKALLHENLYIDIVPQVMPLVEDAEFTYPYPLVDNDTLDTLLSTNDWSTNELQ